MKRRNFFAGAAGFGLGSMMATGTSLAANKEDNRHFFEWIHYELPRGNHKNRVQNYYKNAAIPALNRMGIQPVGLFSVAYGPSQPSLYVLIPHKSMESVLSWQARLMQDQTYMKDSRDYLDAGLSEPAFMRKEHSLFRAFKDLPTIEIPHDLRESSRVFELRIYESHTYPKGQKKIDMFNEGGEIAIFKKTGLSPVFFGEALMGSMMPNLTYMLVFKNMQERDKNWDRFRTDPDWIKLRDDPQYADTVSNITDIILRPVDGSQL
ncbi:MAG: NIPSNAP family protein [Cyclobacteriaceae bacterium]|nr:NIPSNAP family protein [Cyclobacteriaceae bacterium]